MSDSIALAIKPIVRYPRVAQVGKTYLMTIDLEVEPGSEWKYEGEEYPIYCEVESDVFRTQLIGESVIILHRFGGSYGEVRFLIKPLQAVSEKYITIKLINKWGISLKILKLGNLISVEDSQIYMSRNQPYFEEELLSLLRIENLSELGNFEEEIPIESISDREDYSTNKLLNVDEALIWINQYLKFERRSELTDLQCQVFRGCWNSDTYQSIAMMQYRDQDYIREVGAGLLQELSKVFGMQMKKQNFKAIIQQRIALDLPEDETFIGRSEDLEIIDRKWRQEQASIIMIYGVGGIGKTRLARKYLESQSFSVILECWMSSESSYVNPAESQVEKWLIQHFNEEVGVDFSANLDCLQSCLRRSTVPIAILIDNFSTILDENGKVRRESQTYLDMLRMLSESSALTLITSRGILQEGHIKLTTYPLQNLSETNWRQAFNYYRIKIRSTRSIEVLREIWNVCEGNATAMKIVISKICNRYKGDLESYWNDLNQNVLDDYQMQELVADQFNKLQQQQPAAYRLLYRLGSYRYQTPSHISIHGLKAMLWDVSPAQQSATIRILQNLALVESRHGKIFWLHPMIHAESYHRLQRSSDWELAHRKAAAFWLTHRSQPIVKLNDTRMPLEAYYHFLEIKDYGQAAEVLMMPRPNLWGGEIALGWILYRFRSLQQIIETAELIINQAAPGIHLGLLYNLLGYNYRSTGDLNRAIKYHREALAIADRDGFIHLKISSLMNLGLCHRDCWDIEAATQEFRDTYDLAIQAEVPSYQAYAACCLAYLYSGWGDKTIALDYIRKINHYSLPPYDNLWGRAYSLLFLGHTYRNLGDPEAALELFYEALTRAEQSDFIEIQAKALSGSAQIYRILGQLETAIERHTRAIEILDRIDAKCDLAGAYAQRGLTYQQMGNAEQALQDKGMAIGSFMAINLPRQVRWVEDTFRKGA